MMATAVHEGRPIGPCRWPTAEAIEEKLRAASHAATAARHKAENLAAGTVEEVRRHPIRSVGAATVVGALAGSVVGLCAGWFMRPRRRWLW